LTADIVHYLYRCYKKTVNPAISYDIQRSQWNLVDQISEHIVNIVLIFLYSFFGTVVYNMIVHAYWHIYTQLSIHRYDTKKKTPMIRSI